MTQHLIDRRRFNALGAALALASPAAAITALSAGSAGAAETAAPTNVTPTAAPTAGGRTVRLPGGVGVPALGLGSWHLGQGRHPAAEEEEALRLGLTLGLTLIDTSGNYGGGRSEELIGRAIAGRRERVFLVTKVEPDEVAGDGMVRACAASLARLGTDHLDLYLLHWPVARTQFAAVVASFERLRAAGRIRAWGVSNFNAGQMEELFGVADGQRCATNQVPYSLNARGIERDLLPWCRRHGLPVMAYSPLGGDNNLVVRDPRLAAIGAAHGCTAAAVALAWVMRGGDVIAIPESGSPAHVRENAAALALTLSAAELATLDAAFAGPRPG